jgi:hypothetical protein
MLGHEPLPSGEDGGDIGQQLEHTLQSQKFKGCSFGRHSKAVLLNRSSCDDPKFHKVLRNYMKSPAPAGQNLQCSCSYLVLWVTDLEGAQKCAGVDKHGRF